PVNQNRTETTRNKDCISEFFNIYDIRQTTAEEFFCWKYLKTKKLYTYSTFNAERLTYINYMKGSGLNTTEKEFADCQ
ncbi:43956_t:CDS:2, partial [Gigaspora margarita]